MNKIYISDNYIIVDIDGDINTFPKNKSDYEEDNNTFVLRRPNRRIQTFVFSDIGNWFNEDGSVAYTTETLRLFLRQNTGFNTASGGSGADPNVDDNNFSLDYIYPDDETGELRSEFKKIQVIDDVFFELYGDNEVFVPQPFDNGDEAIDTPPVYFQVKDSNKQVTLFSDIQGLLYFEGVSTDETNTIILGPGLYSVEYVKQDTRWLLKALPHAESVNGKSDIESLKNIELQKGTISFADTEYTDTNRLSGQSGVLLQLPNNKGSILNLSAPPNSEDWIDDEGKLIAENGDGDTYLARITFEIDPTLNNRNLRMYLDIGDNSLIDILGETKRLARGAGNDTSIKFEFQYFTLGTFFANGGKIMLDVDGDFEIYDTVYLITRIKKVNL